MAYINNTEDPSFYPSFTSCEFDAYWSQTSAVEQEICEASKSPTNGWNVGIQSSYMASEPISLGAETNSGKCSSRSLHDLSLTRASPESMPLVNSCGAQVHGYDQWLYPECHWSIASQDFQSYHSDIVNQDDPPARAMAPEAPTTIHVPSSCKYFFPREILGNGMLTDCEQFRSITGETMRAGHPPIRSTR